MAKQSRGRNNRNRNKGQMNRYNSSKDQRRDEEIEDTAKRAMNDWTWYAHNEQLLRDSASFSFNNPLGSSFSLGSSYLPTYVPGIMNIRTAFTPGVSRDWTSPVNTAARNLYAFVRHANSGHTNYDAPDLMLYVLAMDSVYAFLSFLIRTYGVMRLYTQRNRYLPAALIYGAGLDFDDLMANLADFRYLINELIVKAGSMCVPNSMSYFTRHSWMYSNIYTDSTGAKAQLYQYVPDSFYMYAPLANDEGGALNPVAFYRGENVYMSFEQLQAYGNELLNAILSDEDMNIMSGDILKAFGQEGIAKLSLIGEDYVVLPVYSEEVLMQIHNLTTCPTLASGRLQPQLAITQSIEDNSLRFDPVFAVSSSVHLDWDADKLFDSRSDSPDAAEVMVSSRLMVGFEKESKANEESGIVYTFGIDSCGSEIVLGRDVMVFNGGEVAPDCFDRYQSQPYYASMGASMTTENVVSKYITLSAEQQFDWHPITVVTSLRADPSATSQYRVYSFNSDLDNYTLLDNKDLRKLHETALLSMLAVPQMGRA